MFLPPLFKDESKTAIPLLDPTNPLRQISFKVVGQESSESAAYMVFELVENILDGVHVPAHVNITKLATSNLDTFEVIVCWSYSDWDNLANNCNESTRHSVINALGSCLSEFNFDLWDWKV